MKITIKITLDVDKLESAMPDKEFAELAAKSLMDDCPGVIGDGVGWVNYVEAEVLK
jgi:hypothetical protein